MITGPCESKYCTQSLTRQVVLAGSGRFFCPDKVEALFLQQSLDQVFIGAYLLLFAYLGLVNIRFGGIQFVQANTRWKRVVQRLSRVLGVLGGFAAAVLALTAAYFDLKEDGLIVAALRHVGAVATLPFPDPAFPDIRGAAYSKWLLLFIAIGCASPLFAFWPGRANRAPGARQSWLMRLVAWAAAIASLLALLSGVAACRAGEDQRIEEAAGFLFMVLPLSTSVLLTAQYWRKGTVCALNKLAANPLFHWLTMLQPEDDSDRPAGDHCD
jgi:hypothetical protein